MAELSFKHMLFEQIKSAIISFTYSVRYIYMLNKKQFCCLKFLSVNFKLEN